MKEEMQMMQQPAETGDSEEMEEMLEAFLTAKKIEADPMKMAKLKEYAMGRNKQIEDLFKVAPKQDIKSFKDMKKRKAELDKMESQEDDE
jgi:hypothetical protein